MGGGAWRYASMFNSSVAPLIIGCAYQPDDPCMGGKRQDLFPQVCNYIHQHFKQGKKNCYCLFPNIPPKLDPIPPSFSAIPESPLVKLSI